MFVSHEELIENYLIIILESSSNQARMNSDRTTEAERAREDRRVARAAFLCSRPVSFFEYGG